MSILGRMDKPETPQEPNEAEQPRLHQLDARSLRGLAHPLRMRLLTALRRGGPATASQLAEKLGESSGATSYHLRQLAAHGFVEDAPEQWWAVFFPIWPDLEREAAAAGAPGAPEASLPEARPT